MISIIGDAMTKETKADEDGDDSDNNEDEI